jgi:hypothetical protein
MKRERTLGSDRRRERIDVVRAEVPAADNEERGPIVDL